MANSDPLKYLAKKLESHKGAVTKICIPDLLKGAESNVIVVDGPQFYGQFVYPKFDWICGDLGELVDVVRRFVLAFERVGAKLVFFFVDGHLDEGSRRLGYEDWRDEHSLYAQYAVKLYETLKTSNYGIDKIINERYYYHTPFHAQSVVLFVLKHVLKCEIHFVHSGFRNDSVAYYARNNKCLALLAEDKMYLFYKNLPNYLSLKNLNLGDMTTKLYNLEVLPDYFGISEHHLYPSVIRNAANKEFDVMIAFLNEMIEKYESEEFVMCDGVLRCLNDSYEYDEEEEVNIEKKNLGEKEKIERKEQVKPGAQANEQIDNKDNTQRANKEDGSEEADIDCDSSDIDRLCVIVDAEYICFNKGYIMYKMCGPLKYWESVCERAEELYSDGLMSRKIKLLIVKNEFYNDCILEDFVELPSSSLVYQPLRKSIYGILFHEAPPEEFAGFVKECCISKTGCVDMAVHVDPLPPNIKNIHMGLLNLWNLNDVSDDTLTAKCQLFSSCISFHLCNELNNLPPRLVVPTVVLFYLYEKVPSMFKNYKFLEPWEVDVFIVQFLMLPKTSAVDLSKIKVTKYNSRALKLIAMFVYGCLNMQLLVQVCGSFINKNDTCLLHYFNGKLFHLLYEKAEWRRRNFESQLRDEESLRMFHKIKQIVVQTTV